MWHRPLALLALAIGVFVGWLVTRWREHYARGRSPGAKKEGGKDGRGEAG
jgi:hypothetical protein